jgi:predicted aspartyl protease
MARRVKTDMKIWNFVDEELARRNVIKQEDVIILEFKDVAVDTGATRLILPKKTVDKLNLREDGKVWVRYANMQRAKKPLVRGVSVEILGRVGTFDAVIEERDTPLVGMEVLEGLDLWPDVKEGKLITNPESPDMPLFDLFIINI